MVDFTSVPHIFQSWSTDPSTQPPGSSDGSMQPQHSGYHQPQLEGSSPQSRYHHPVVGSGSPQQPVDDSHSVGSPPQFSGYERRFPHFSKETNHAESSSPHGWNDGKNVHLADEYPTCGTTSTGTTSDYSYTKYDYGQGDAAAGAIGSSVQGHITSDNSFVYQQQQSYYFYNGIPMSGPTPGLHLSSMSYGQDRPSTTLASDQYTTEDSEKHSTPISSLSAPTIAREMASASISPPPENLRTASPLIQCTFAYYEPPKPSERKSPAKKKKPVMACLFCRVRKIACAPPVPGGLETRCNQCARRDIACEYPKESRRGQYRRLQYLERVGKEVAEKIAEVERQSAMIAAGDRKKGVRKLSAACQPY